MGLEVITKVNGDIITATTLKEMDAIGFADVKL
jgi:hypothetical protein